MKLNEIMKRIVPIFLFLILALTGCKPTEKGYKAAYDAALGKREAARADIIDASIPEGALQDVDGPQLKEVDGVKVYVLNQRIKAAEEGESLPGNYNVAVGCYKMVTNCRSQVNTLRGDGLEAYAAQDSDGMFYTIAGSFKFLSEAVKFSEKYRAGKDRVFVGLPNAPVIIYSQN